MPLRDLAKERHWRRLLRQWRQSGLTGRDFCTQHSLSEPSFYTWKREIERRDRHKSQQRRDQTQRQRAANFPPAATQDSTAGAATAAFVQLTLDQGSAVTPAIEVIVDQRRVLRVRPGFDAELLRQLLHLLEEPSC